MILAEAFPTAIEEHSTLLTAISSVAVGVIIMVVKDIFTKPAALNASITNLRETLSEHVNGLYKKIDDTEDKLSMRIEGGLRSIDIRMDDHFRDDVKNFEAARKDTGEVGHALRDKISQVEFYIRDNYPATKHLDEKIAGLMQRLDHQDRVSDARHEMSQLSNQENRTAHADVVKRLDAIERNGKH